MTRDTSELETFPPAECPYCGDSEVARLIDIYPEDRSFCFDACCDRFEAELREALCGDGRHPCPATEILDALGWSAYFGKRPRSLYVDLGHLEFENGITLAPVTLAFAKAFIADHHRHNPPPLSWRFGYAIRNGDLIVAVCTCGRPVARGFDPERVLEITRVCTNAGLHPALTRDACSMLYGACAREANRRGFERIITYTLPTERGASLRASGYTPIAITRGGSWNTRSRLRACNAPAVPKIRWERTFPRNAGRRPSRRDSPGQMRAF